MPRRERRQRPKSVWHDPGILGHALQERSPSVHRAYDTYEKLYTSSWEWKLDRRAVLKSAAALVGASAIGASARTPTVQAQQPAPSPHHFPKQQIGFTL